jgi:hypothetical protein
MEVITANMTGLECHQVNVLDHREEVDTFSHLPRPTTLVALLAEDVCLNPVGHDHHLSRGRGAAMQSAPEAVVNSSEGRLVI